jgi:hypothetical protein
MVLTLAFAPRYYDLEDFITMRPRQHGARDARDQARGRRLHDGGLHRWYSASSYEEFMITNRFFGPNKLHWSLIFCNVIAPS